MRRNEGTLIAQGLAVRGWGRAAVGLGQASLAMRAGNHISCPSGQQLWCSGPGQAGGLWEQVGAMPASYYDSGHGLLVACRTQEGRWPAHFSSQKLQWYSRTMCLAKWLAPESPTLPSLCQDDCNRVLL